MKVPAKNNESFGFSHPQKNIGRHCWGINTLSQSGLDVFLVFLAQPPVPAAVSGVVLLRRCESQADFLLAVVVFVMTTLRLISIRPHSLRSSIHGSIAPSLILVLNFLAASIKVLTTCGVLEPLQNNLDVLSWFLHLQTLLMQISHLHHWTQQELLPLLLYVTLHSQPGMEL